MSETSSQRSDITYQRQTSEARKYKPTNRSSEDQMSEKRSERIESAKDLKVYKVAYELAMEIFELTKKFPSQETFALTSQIRRSSRSICLNLREAWAKRRYEAHFV